MSLTAVECVVQVGSIVDLVREGRCALHTRLACYKFLITYGLHFSVLNIACYWYAPFFQFLLFSPVSHQFLWFLSTSSTLSNDMWVDSSHVGVPEHHVRMCCASHLSRGCLASCCRYGIILSQMVFISIDIFATICLGYCLTLARPAK